jgi:transcriptional regulator with XRE-family HTH domain
MVYAPDDQKALFLKRLGADLREIREAAGLSLEAASRVLTPDNPSRDRLSKVERGVSGIDLHAYLELMFFYRTYGYESHPAVALAQKLLTSENKDSLDV